ncbi:MAG: hypothetical protein Q7S03_00555 [bacterium]|nr:hypothetical protein [bacterium]
MSQAYLITGGRASTRQEKLQELYVKNKPSGKFTSDPDIHLLESETTLKIEDVRELGRILSLKPRGQEPKVAIIKEADRLTFEAQGALLKILEEPPGKTLFLLTTLDLNNLLPTIPSRCQIIFLPQEGEISLDKNELKEVKVQTEEIIKSGLGKRVEIAEKFSTKEEALLFCKKQLVYWREELLVNPTIINLEILKEIQKTLTFLSANTNPRLTIENLLLSYPKN